MGKADGNETDWKAMNHELPADPIWEKYLVMFCEAGSADNELKLLTRFQKIIRKIYDEQVVELRESVLEAFTQACGKYDREKQIHSYDHCCLSTWEHAQRQLLSWGMIKPEQCVRE